MTTESTVEAGVFERLQVFAAELGCVVSRIEDPDGEALWRISGPLEVTYCLTTREIFVTGAKGSWTRGTPFDAAISAVRPPPKRGRPTRARFHPSHRQRVLELAREVADEFECHWCGCVLEPKKVTIDHVIPRARGGTSKPENLVVACKACNNFRGFGMPELAGWNPKEASHVSSN